MGEVDCDLESQVNMKVENYVQEWLVSELLKVGGWFLDSEYMFSNFVHPTLLSVIMYYRPMADVILMRMNNVVYPEDVWNKDIFIKDLEYKILAYV